MHDFASQPKRADSSRLSKSFGDSFNFHKVMEDSKRSQFIHDAVDTVYRGYLWRRSRSKQPPSSPYREPSPHVTRPLFEETGNMPEIPEFLLPSSNQLIPPSIADDEDDDNNNNNSTPLQNNTESPLETTSPPPLEPEPKPSSPDFPNAMLQGISSFFGLNKQQDDPAPSPQPPPEPIRQRPPTQPIKVRHARPVPVTIKPVGNNPRICRSLDLGPRFLSLTDKGSVWNGRYCVLENQTLYIYADEDEAMSEGAVRERKADGSNKSSSPSGIYPTEETGNKIAEDAIPLQQNASVKCAEHDYGVNSFTISGAQNGDDSTMVFRAQTAKEMREWIFQFHLSLASVQNKGDSLLARAAHLNIEYPSQRMSVPNIHSTSSTNPGPQQRLVSSTRENGVMIRPLIAPKAQRSKGGSSGLTQQLEGYTKQEESDKPVAKPSGLSMMFTDNAASKSPKSAKPAIKPAIKAAGKYVPPHMRKESPAVAVKPAGKYLPPHLRNKQNTWVPVPPPPEEDESPPAPALSAPHTSAEVADMHRQSITLGGCADPALMSGSILDDQYIPEKASRTKESALGPTGGFGGTGSRTWDTGAVSIIGGRTSNEDAFLILHDLVHAIDTDMGKSTPSSDSAGGNEIGLFALFDGHGGNEAARYAAEKLVSFIGDELANQAKKTESALLDMSSVNSGNVQLLLEEALIKMDAEFCRWCREGERNWESGTTALVAVLGDGWLVTASLGDCQGFICRTESNTSNSSENDWIPLEPANLYHEESGEGKCMWKEVTIIHKPSDGVERVRIEEANGWVTSEPDQAGGVGGFLRQRLSEQYLNSNATGNELRAPDRGHEISRVCGELSVSRALGDRDFKAAYNTEQSVSPEIGSNEGWGSSLCLPYPHEHSYQFYGDLISNSPEFQRVEVEKEASGQEFLLFASDGLWDVLSVEDALRISRDLLFHRRWPSKLVAATLAELAKELQSLDNITVIVVRLQHPGQGNESST